jgi:surface protein
MKKIYLLLVLVLTTTISFSQNEFITTWEVTSGDLDIAIYTNTDDYTYNYTIDFGDGNILNNITGDYVYTYANSGTYIVKVTGTYPYFRFSSSQLKSVDQWGDNQWLSMSIMFASCSNMIINATDTPDLSQVTSMENMFADCDLFNQPINNWDVSNVENMNGMFAYCNLFNQPLNDWDVSNVETMIGMFNSCNLFNQPLNDWDVSNVCFL